MDIEPELPIRAERLLAREIAKITWRALAGPISGKVGLPERARINANGSVDMLTLTHLPRNRETPPVAFASHEWPLATICECARKVDRYRSPATRLGRKTEVADRKRAA